MTSFYPANKSQPTGTRIRGFCRVLADHEWLILALILPTVLYTNPALFVILLLIPLLWLVRRIGCGHFIVATPLDVALLLLATMLLVSLYATFDLAFSLPKIAGLVYGLGVYYAAVAATSRSWSRLAKGVSLLLACGLIVALFSLLGTDWKDAFPFLSDVVNMLPQILLFSAAPEGFSPNQVAGTLLWVLPVAAAAVAISNRGSDFWPYRVGPGLRRLTAFLSLGLLIFVGSVFLFTQSRSAYAGLAGALLLLGLGFGIRSRRPVIMALLLTLALAAAGIWLLAKSERQVESAGLASLVENNSASMVQESPASIVSTISLQGRVEIWSRALYGLEDFPLTGLGLGAFRRVVPILYPLFLTAPDQDIAHAHNQFLQVGLDLGLPGLIAYLALWVGAAAMLWQSWQLAPTIEARWLVLGFSTALLAYFLYGFTETVALGAKPGFIFWLLLGLVTSLHRLTYYDQRASLSVFVNKQSSSI